MPRFARFLDNLGINLWVPKYNFELVKFCVVVGSCFVFFFVFLKDES